MSQFSWESEVIDQPQQSQPQPEAVQQAEFEPERPQAQDQDPSPEPGALALTVDDFSALEERVLRAVNLVKRERLARAEAEQRALQAEARFAGQLPQIERLQTELDALRAERDHVRQRVERLLSQLDALEL